MAAQLEEFFPFLHDGNPQIRQVALQSIIGHTPADAPHHSIFLAGMKSGEVFQTEAIKDTELARDLKLLCRDKLVIAHDAFRGLINLSESPLWVTSLSEPSFLAFLVSYILHPPSVLADLAAMLLSNLTAHHSVCAEILSMKIPVVLDPSLSYSYYPVHSRSETSRTPSCSQGNTIDLPALPLLVDALASSVKLDIAKNSMQTLGEGMLHFLATVFANISATPQGRLFFLTPSPTNPLSTHSTSDMEYPISKLISFTEFPDTIRRRGVVSVIKNCAFHAPAHQALLMSEMMQTVIPPSTTSASGVNILPAILLPLAGPEEFDLEDQETLPLGLQFLGPGKRREPDSVIRLTHVETLLLLCTTRWGREFLRDNGTYEIIRVMHENEEIDTISENIERLVNLLKRDEGEEADDGVTLDQATVSEDERIEEV